MKALIHNGKVVDLSEVPFEVHASMVWVDASEDVKHGWEYSNGSFAEPKEYQKTISEQRRSAYPSIQEQLDMQYWDSVNGTTTWADAIAAVKAAHPKGA